jgi:ribulose-5-phosphate 4-epimerase/fuculose-1-phosphate aldolase
MAGDMTSQERDLRIQLAAVYRLVDHFGWTDLVWTHSTVRLPGTEHFLINPYTLRFDEVCASNLVKVDKDGNIIGDPAQEINPAGFVIHSAVHMMRPDVQCVMHTHTVAGMAVAALECGILPINLHALGYYERVSYHDFEGPSLDPAERARLGANLGKNNILILRNHGLLTCGETIAQTFVRMYRLQRICEIQIAALSTGQKLVVPPVEVCELTARLADDFLSTEGGKGYSRKANPEFDAMVRLLDKKDPSYRD